MDEFFEKYLLPSIAAIIVVSMIWLFAMGPSWKWFFITVISGGCCVPLLFAVSKARRTRNFLPPAGIFLAMLFFFIWMISPGEPSKITVKESDPYGCRIGDAKLCAEQRKDINALRPMLR